MSLEERLALAVEALHRIATFWHAEACTGSAPVHECCCQDIYEVDIARECLVALGESERRR